MHLQDLPRTFPLNAWVGSPEGQDALRRVLLAFSVHKPDVGYCQSMNYVAAMLLLCLDLSEERAFWVMVALIDDNGQYFKAAMLGIVYASGLHASVPSHKSDPLPSMNCGSMYAVAYMPADTCKHAYGTSCFGKDRLHRPAMPVSMLLCLTHTAALMHMLQKQLR